jgi:peptidoglycan hydrolase-like protein with peptidoglycan-binding domain
MRRDNPFGLGAVVRPPSKSTPVLPILAGAVAGIGAAFLARKYGVSPWGTVAGGIGSAIVVGVTAGRFTHHAMSPSRPLAPRGPQIVSTPGGFVRTVQHALTNAGFDTGGADNDWGSHTYAAARAFQSAHGMTTTGLPEPELLRALGVAIPSYPQAQAIASALAGNLAGVVEPRDALKIMLGESGMNPAAVAYHDSKPVAGGVFGLLVTETQNLTGMSFSDWIQLSAAQQIPYAAKFWRQITSGFGAPSLLAQLPARDVRTRSA